MTVEMTFDGFLIVFIVLYGLLLWEGKRRMDKGDFHAVSAWLRGTPFLSRSIKRKILLKTLDNQERSSQ